MEGSLRVSFNDIKKAATLRLLQMHYESGVGHIGGNLSCLDTLLYLHHFAMKGDDSFILSKGHAAGALYITLWSKGVLSDEQLKTFHKDGTRLSGHPAPNWINEIAFATGSLGHGVGLACGMAIGKKLKNEEGRIFCLTSDGEWQEGSNWEALIMLAHNKPDNLTLLMDCNGLQGFGGTDDVASMNAGRLEKAFSQFDIDVVRIKDINEKSLHKALTAHKGKNPQVILLDSVKGKGVSFMENKMEWHYLPMTEEQYKQARMEVERS